MSVTTLPRTIAVVTTLAALVATPAWAQPPAAQAQAGTAPAAGALACTFQHPAIARRAGCATSAGIDTNRFLVQPPATVSWTVVTPDLAYAAAPAPALR